MEEGKVYSVVLKNDKTLKQFFERFYVLPKDIKYSKEKREFLEENKFVLSGEDVINGKNGYIVERPGKKLTRDQVEIIKKDTGSQRAKAKKYNVSVGTINKIMNNKY
ncbi:hypothetical protein [Clostridium saudiense]|uniref:hypothetical protein n=1 Tax=Clostridium saudiense TaxID=1414720 RepID=UPI0018AB9927|nr:hypothetical protein [Clostridium saudiense]